MVLVVGHLRQQPGEEEEPAPEEGKAPAVRERKVEVWVEAKAGSTVGWVLSRVMEELASKDPDVPAIVGLRVVPNPKAAGRRPGPTGALGKPPPPPESDDEDEGGD